MRVRDGRGRGIRTPDTLLPKQVRYQAALYPVLLLFRYLPVYSPLQTLRYAFGYSTGFDTPRDLNSVNFNRTSHGLSWIILF